jgi:predicted nucleic acid-binding protein
MEKMVRRICLDSDVLIGILNKDEAAKQLVDSIDGEFYTTSVNVFELWYGRKKQELIFELFESLRLLALGSNAARLAADILRSLKEKGMLIDLRDAFIAAMCIRQDVELLTLNKKHFERLAEFGLVLA